MALTSLDQKLDWWPHGINPLLWEDAENILRTSDNFNHVEAVCKFFLDPSVAKLILGGRQQGWLNTFLNGLCRDRGIPVPRCDSKAKARAIVDIVRDSSPSGEEWNGYWIFQALLSPDITTCAVPFDTQLHSMVRTIPFSHLVSWLNGYRNRFSEFLDAVFNLSSALAQYIRGEDRFKDALVLLLPASSFLGKHLGYSLT
jgi:hypothetical protein